jgi:hypothetical protein
MTLFTKIFSAAFFVISLAGCQSNETSNAAQNTSDSTLTQQKEVKKPVEDSATYYAKLLSIANGDTNGYWPIKNNPQPLKGAILPYNRIVAYYGNLYSKKMGILGEFPPAEVWRRLNEEVKAWEKADSLTPVVPAIHYIAVVAQGSAGKDGKYRTRMPEKQIDSALTIAKMGNAIVFLDVQIALSDFESEIPLLEKYLKMPNVHLGIDPEFAMHDGVAPGRKIGSIDAKDINYCSQYLAQLVKDNNLPPKILIVHRFTQGMVKKYSEVELCPEVQIVINMDGWGEPVLKFSTYKLYIYREPVQFTGFKLFYKNDLKKAPNRMLTPEELLKLKPNPIYIQYQ